MEEVEILKIGSILPSKTIMVVSDGGSIFDYYVNKLRKGCDGEYSFLKTTKSIVGNPRVFSSLVGNQPIDILKGISDDDPVVGQSFAINNSTWRTSEVIKIVDKVVILTENSVYALHNISNIRDEKIKNIGL